MKGKYETKKKHKKKKLSKKEKLMIEGYKKTAKQSLEINKEWEATEKEANRFLDDYGKG